MAVDSAKRPRDGGLGEQHDVQMVLKVLQRVLPLLKPAEVDSPLKTEGALQLLVAQWARDAGLKPPPVPNVAARIKSRLKERLGDTWTLVEKADEEEKTEIIAFVQMLITGEGRGKLIEMYGARMEESDGSVEVAAEQRVGEQQIGDPEPAASWEPMLKVGAFVQLHGLSAASWM